MQNSGHQYYGRFSLQPGADFRGPQAAYTKIKAATGIFKGRHVLAKPEYSDCAAIAKEQNIPLKAVMKEAMSSYRANTANNNVSNHKAFNNKML